MLHPVRFLFEEIDREWGFEPPRRHRREDDRRLRERRRFQNLGALLLIR